MSEARPHALHSCLSRDAILRLAGGKYFQRGVNYFEEGRVGEIVSSDCSIEATVAGSADYLVQLTAVSGTLEYDCNCPLGVDGSFCKHCVALGLAWIDLQSPNAPTQGDGATQTRKLAKTQITDREIAQAINAADKETLVRLLLDSSRTNAELKAKLTQMAALSQGPETGVALARKSLEKAIRIRRYVDYRHMQAYAAGVEAALDGVEMLLSNGHATSVIALCEAGMRWLSTAMQNVDDSDGYMMPLSGRLQDLHLRACMEARPDPTALARTLFEAEMNSCFDEWSNAVETYAELLGEVGLAAYRSLAQAAWARVPARTEAVARQRDQDYSAITRIMEAAARQSGNVEELVAVLERDLSYPHKFMQVVEAYRQAGDRDKALAWAERGMKATSGYDGAGLRKYVADEYRRTDRHADAVRIMWVEFRENTDLKSYKQLEDFARAADDWEDWRDQALGHVRRGLSERGRAGQDYARRDHSLLVEIFLYEGREDDAWAEAQAGGCYERLWLQLAELRKKQHPGDAKSIYMRLAEQAIQRSMGNYDDAVAFLEQAATLATAMGTCAEFEAELDVLLLGRHKAKRNLHKRVAERRHLLYLQTATR